MEVFQLSPSKTDDSTEWSNDLPEFEVQEYDKP